MIPTPITEEEKPGKMLRERLNESTGQQTPKKRSSNSMKVEQMRRRAKAPVETHAAILKRGNRPHKEDAEA